jgi:hypothetical protein
MYCITGRENLCCNIDIDYELHFVHARKRFNQHWSTQFHNNMPYQIVIIVNKKLQIFPILDQPFVGEREAIFLTIHLSWIHRNSKKNNWIHLWWQYAHLQMAMKHLTKSTVTVISNLDPPYLKTTLDPPTQTISTFKNNWRIVQSFHSLWSTIYDKWVQAILHTQPLLDPP